MIVLAFFPTLHWAFEKRDPVTDAFLAWWKETFGFQVAALYIIVRGLDVFHKPPEGTRRPTILLDTGRFSTQMKG